MCAGVGQKEAGVIARHLSLIVHCNIPWKTLWLAICLNQCCLSSESTPQDIWKCAPEFRPSDDVEKAIYFDAIDRLKPPRN